MAKLKIEAYYNVDKLGESTFEIFENDQLMIKIFDGDKLVAETNLESLVMKFLLISGEHANAMALLGMIEASHDDKHKIVIAKPGDIPKEQ